MNQPLTSQQNEPRNPEHKRINDAFLRPLEKPALNWLAAHMPYWVTPDHLTALGMFASVLIAASLILTNISPAYLWLASLGVVLNWFGDSLDGTLARYRKIERSNYGYFIDHAVDALDEVLIFLALGISPYVRMELAGLALVSYLLLSIQSFLYSQVSGVFQISFIRIGPTEMRCIMILSNTVVFFIGNPIGGDRAGYLYFVRFRVDFHHPPAFWRFHRHDDTSMHASLPLMIRACWSKRSFEIAFGQNGQRAGQRLKQRK